MTSKQTNTKNTLKHVGQSVLILLMLTLVFWMSLTLVYCIPEKAIEPHAVESAEILADQGQYAATQTEDMLAIDNFSPAWMVNIAAQAPGNPFVDALTDTYSKVSDPKPITWLEEWAKNPDGDEYGNYWRYWTGYLVYLKPLLVLFNVRQIQFIFQIVFVLLMFGAAVSLVRRLGAKGPSAAMALAAAYVVMHGFDAAHQLATFPTFTISVIGVIWALRVRDSEWPIARGFLLIGAFAVFFDLLYNPLLTLGMPLCTLILRFIGEKAPRWILKNLLLGMLAWGCAYGIIWFMKWVLCTLVTGYDLIGEALRQADYRSGGGNQGEYTHLTVILKGFAKNLIIREHILPVIFGLLVVLLAALVLCFVLKRKGRLTTKDLWAGIGLYALVGALPYLWILVFGNHSAEHSFFTYRNQIITVFALLLGIQSVASFIPTDLLPWKRKEGEEGQAS